MIQKKENDLQKVIDSLRDIENELSKSEFFEFQNANNDTLTSQKNYS